MYKKGLETWTIYYRQASTTSYKIHDITRGVTDIRQHSALAVRAVTHMNVERTRHQESKFGDSSELTQASKFGKTGVFDLDQAILAGTSSETGVAEQAWPGGINLACGNTLST